MLTQALCHVRQGSPRSKVRACIQTDGFWEWVESVRQHYDLFIFSSHFINASTVPRTQTQLETTQ